MSVSWVGTSCKTTLALASVALSHIECSTHMCMFGQQPNACQVAMVCNASPEDEERYVQKVAENAHSQESNLGLWFTRPLYYHCTM